MPWYRSTFSSGSLLLGFCKKTVPVKFPRLLVGTLLAEPQRGNSLRGLEGLGKVGQGVKSQGGCDGSQGLGGVEQKYPRLLELGFFYKTVKRLPGSFFK